MTRNPRAICRRKGRFDFRRACAISYLGVATVLSEGHAAAENSRSLKPHIVGNANAPPSTFEQCAGREIIVGAKNGGGRRRALHQLTNRLRPRVTLEGASKEAIAGMAPNSWTACK